MNLASISENHNIEKRIAITPEIAKKYISLGFNLTLSNDYGTHLGFSDEDYKNLGVNFLENEDEIIKNSDIVIQLGLPDDKKFSQFKENLAQVLVEKISPVSEEIGRLINEKKFLNEILLDGYNKANNIASKKLKMMQKIIGF